MSSDPGLPSGATDCHVHLIGDDYALSPKAVETPPPGTLDDWLERYRAHLASMGCTRGVIVHSILYGGDNSITLEATRRMGDGFRAVCLITDDATEAQIADLAAQNCKAVRLNYVHGGLLSWDGAVAMAPALAERGLHIQMLLHADLHIQDLAAQIRALPVPLVIDHLGWPSGAMDPQSAGFQTLCALMAEGHVYTKLSAPYRMCDAPYDAAAACTSALIATNPERCLWGSDWPHLMLNGAGMPHAADLLDAVDALIPDDATRQAIFVDTPARLFGWTPQVSAKA